MNNDPSFPPPPPPPPANPEYYNPYRPPFEPAGVPQALTADERNLGMLCHLLGFCGLIIPLGNVVGPLILWMMQKEKSAYVDWHGKEALNFQISFSIYLFVASLLILILIGLLLLPAVGLVWLIFMIIGSIRASNGVTWRYPLTIPFLR